MRSQKADEVLARIRSQATPYELEFCSIRIRVDKDVYPTGELSELVVEAMDHPEFGVCSGNFVLDFGTGTGFLAVAAAKRGAQVTALDINPSAVACAKVNAQLNHLDDAVDVRESRNMSALRDDERFDIVFAGIPWEDAEPHDVLERSVYDPQFEARRALFEESFHRLNPNGRIFMTYSERVQQIYPIEKTHPGFTYDVLVQRVIKGVSHYAYLIRPRTSA